jgi:hypothetical protein
VRTGRAAGTVWSKPQSFGMIPFSPLRTESLLVRGTVKRYRQTLPVRAGCTLIAAVRYGETRTL